MADSSVIKNDSSSDDDHHEKVTLLKLHRDNWTEWKKFFVNLLVGRGHEEIFDEEWCKTHAEEKIFRKKSALAFTLLQSCLSSDLKPVAAGADSFSKAMESLAEMCGEQSLIKLGDKLFALVSCDYVPGTSIGAHVSKFQNLYNSLKSAVAATKNSDVDDKMKNDMDVGTTMAGIFFLKSFRLDDSKSLRHSTIYLQTTCRSNEC
ncbi:uncharacterized protein PGTG_05326 [Puccinia graminis f. sp. tritici CRL 75-36-700-3]|uniref:Uncharacterized protein n=1 Tax=Puccinia graminis f. sp. tritici (strain CRL 75-36-700-3 / race SCCL) TaxID=418459 RepID=E3K725_PUCGT|nr:uncharacterized protein PGTG_05326 [Puccinia graminis f. sp. tritici CRL 75-36-700-3]EFP80101.1 hypothetical protein PGTG_05326 [Puccinia graminis f. sp. tritici CRL 75-36-700-3]